MAIESGKPFTRENWNEDIIQEVNDLCENPDEGCDPLLPIEKVDKDHIWTKQDVTEVQDKLIIICPENIFDPLAEDQIWTYSKEVAIIKPIEEAIERGWCNCKPIRIDLGTYTKIELEAGRREHESGGVIKEVTMCGTYFTQYHSPWYPGVDNDDLEAEHRGLQTEISNYRSEYSSLSHATFRIEDKIEELEAAIAILEEQIEQLETELNLAEIVLADLKTIRDAICNNAPDSSACDAAWDAVDDQQGIIDNVKSELNGKKGLKEQKETQLEYQEGKLEEKKEERQEARDNFNQKAQEEWSLLKTFQLRFDTDLCPINDVIPEMLAEDFDWGDYFEDTRDENRKGSWKFYATDICRNREGSINGYFSPDGYPYVSHGFPRGLVHIVLTCTYAEITVWHQCNCYAWQLNPHDCCYKKDNSYECGHYNRTIYWAFWGMVYYPNCTAGDGTRMIPYDWHLEFETQKAANYTRPEEPGS